MESEKEKNELGLQPGTWGGGKKSRYPAILT